MLNAAPGIRNWDRRWEYVRMRDLNGTVGFRYETEPDSGQFHDGPSLGEKTFPRYSIARNADGRLEIFAIRRNGQAIHNWQGTKGGGWQASWETLANDAADINAHRNGDGRLEIAILKSNNEVNYSRQSLNGTWSGGNLGGSVEMMELHRNHDDRLVILALTKDASVAQQCQRTPNGEWTGHWDPLPAGGPFRWISAEANLDGRLQVFANHLKTETVWYSCQNRPNGEWKPWVEIKGLEQCWGIRTNTHNNGRIIVFGFAAGGSFYNIQAAANEDWAGWQQYDNTQDSGYRRIRYFENGKWF